MKAMVLAAGLGARLRPLTNTVPKPLIPVANKTLLERLLVVLRANGVDEVVINVHHLACKIIDVIGNGSRYGLRVIWSREDQLLGTGGGLAQVAELFLNETAFFVVNADVIVNLDLSAVLSEHLARGVSATAVVQRHRCQNLSWLGMDQLSTIRWVPGMHPVDGYTKVLFTGIHVLSPAIFGSLRKGELSCILRAGYRSLLERGHQVYAHLVPDGSFLEVGRPDQLIEANAALLLNGVDGRSDAPNFGDVDIANPVSIAAGVSFGRSVRIGPFVTIGARAVLGDNVSVFDSVILPDSTVAPDRQLKRSIVWSGGELSIDDRDSQPS